MYPPTGCVLALSPRKFSLPVRVSMKDTISLIRSLFKRLLNNCSICVHNIFLRANGSYDKIHYVKRRPAQVFTLVFYEQLFRRCAFYCEVM